MLTSYSSRRERLLIIKGVPALDSYKEPTGTYEYDPDTAEPLWRASLSRGSSTANATTGSRVVEGITITDGEAVLIVLGRFELTPELYRIKAEDGIWTPMGDPVTRYPIASGMHSVVKMEKTESRRV
ncbi:head-to-tail stopper [Microbacterium phage Mabodamaca]|uniref:Head-to-tail stopper n=1 Tax=Microbacterium phage Mabodamaca TaxID=3078574 RepID=A0AA96NFI1_9CAUD|nr:head-to-tail stopper [Microbacterium phage Mabodamaca]